MKRKYKALIALICVFVLMLSICINASAFFGDGYKFPVLIAERCSGVSMYWSGEYIGKAFEYRGTVYAPLLDFLELLTGSPCTISCDLPYSLISISCGSFELLCYPEQGYISVNGRYIPLDSSPKEIDGIVWFPITALTKAIGAKLHIGTGSRYCNIVYTSGSPVPTANDVYNAEDLYWLSRVIFSEAGTQSLEGMIGVGNVVLNRVESTRFPDSIYEVIFQKNQFSVVDCGMIYREPDERSVIAAKLCFEGADCVGESLYFINPSLCNGSWFRNNLTFLERIGEHEFFV